MNGLTHLIQLLVLILAFSFAGFSQQNVSGLISSNTTWSMEEGPYYIVGNILVSNGATLTIGPGTEVLFGKDRAIQVEGTIAAIGTEQLPISITSSEANPEDDGWDAFYLTSTSNGAVFDDHGSYISGHIFKHVNFEYGGYGSSSLGNKDFIEGDVGCYLSNVNVTNCQRLTITAGSQDIHIDSSRIADCRVSLGTQGTIKVIGNTFESTSVAVDDCPKGYIVNNKFSGGYTGVTGGFHFDTLWVRDNHFHGVYTALDFQEFSPNGWVVLERNLIDSSMYSYIINADVRHNIFIQNPNPIVHSVPTSGTLNISNNQFIDCGGPSSIGASSDEFLFYEMSSTGQYSFTHNLFDGTYLNNNQAILDLPYPTKTLFEGNNFVHTGVIGSYLKNESATEDIVATSNYWDGLEESALGPLMYDWFDNVNTKFIQLTPVLLTPDMLAPLSRPSNPSGYHSCKNEIGWDGKLEQDIAGYRVHFGVFDGKSFDSTVDVGLDTLVSYLELLNSDLVAITSYDHEADGEYDQFEGHESWYSFIDLKQVVETSVSNNPIALDSISGSGATLITADVNSGFSMVWNTGEISPSINADTSGWYIATVQDARGCERIDSVYFSLITGDVAEPMKTAELLFPNPVSSGGKVLVSQHFDLGRELPQVLSVEGKTIRADFQQTNGKLYLNTTKLLTGVYTIVFGSQTQKLVIRD